MKKSLGLYIHVPFCLKRCGYCDFCSLAGKNEEYMTAYADELCRRIAGAAEAVREYRVDTVYFGGGTPSLLPLSCVERIMDAVFDACEVDANAEITLECNPATASACYLSALRSMGINRLSMGLQSAVDSELALLGRVHTASDFVHSLEDARTAGFDNISADLMYGIPEQDAKSLEYSLRFLTALSPEHISAYGLMLEEGTELERKRNTLRLADDDGQYDMYMLLSSFLGERGYEKYEISNFARDGRYSRHNMRYWLGEEYLGFGAAAHSCFGGNRFGNSRDVDAFIRGADITEESYALTESDVKREYVMLRLRLCSGIDLADYRARFSEDFIEAFPRLGDYIDGGFMRLSSGRLAFTDKGFFVSNSILCELI